MYIMYVLIAFFDLYINLTDVIYLNFFGEFLQNLALAHLSPLLIVSINFSK